MKKENKNRKNEETADRKVSMTVRKIVNMYGIYAQMKPSGRVPKEDRHKIARNFRAMMEVATAHEKFVAETRKLLKPARYDEMLDMHRDFEQLSDSDKRMVNRFFMDYDREIEECVTKELDREVEISAPEKISADACEIIAMENGLTLLAQTMLEDYGNEE